MLNFTKKGFFVILLSLNLVSGSVFAGGVPTIDVANILQTTVTAFENIEQTVTMVESLDNEIKQYQQQIQQYQQQIQQYQSMTGPRGLESLLTSGSQAQDRRWAPTDWRTAMTTIKAGGIPGTNSSYKAIYSQMKGDLGVLTSSELDMPTAGDMGAYSRYHDESVASNMLALSLSENAYTDTNKRTGEIEALIGQIDGATDQKSALDLTNVLLSKMLTLQNESIRLQAALLQSSAMSSASFNGAATMEAKYNTGY